MDHIYHQGCLEKSITRLTPARHSPSTPQPHDDGYITCTDEMINPSFPHYNSSPPNTSSRQHQDNEYATTPNAPIRRINVHQMLKTAKDWYIQIKDKEQL